MDEELENFGQEECNLTFSRALELLKEGYNIQRQGWNGKNMYLEYKNGYPVNKFLSEAQHEKQYDGSTFGHQVEGQMLPHIVMKTAGDSYYWGEGYADFVPWLASQTDILAEDWRVVE